MSWDCCKVGIESTADAFHRWNCQGDACITKTNPLVDNSSPEMLEYTKKLCSIAEDCKKVCSVGADYISCITTTFCETAGPAIKEMGRTVYHLNQQDDKALVAQLLPYAIGLTVGGFAVGKLINSYAPKKSIWTPCAAASYVVGGLGAILLWRCGQIHLRSLS